MWDENHPRYLLFAGDVLLSSKELEERDRRMSVEVKGLADVVRSVKQAISVASNAAADMQKTAQSVVSKINQVNSLHQELVAADADLAAAIGEMSNGGPPLAAPADTTNSATPSPVPSPAPASPPAPEATVTAGVQDTTVDHAKAQVMDANARVAATADKYIAKPAA